MNPLLQAGANFLLYEKRCDIISTERGLYDYLGRPDILGVTRDRKLIEVEIKRSFSDFKANFDKRIIGRYRDNPRIAPHYFYFLITADIEEKVMDYSREDTHKDYGILVMTHKFIGVRSARKAKLNKEAQKLSIKQMITMVRNQSKTLLEEWKRVDIHLSQTRTDLPST